MSKRKPIELHPQIKDIIRFRVNQQPLTYFEEERLEVMRNDILEKISQYKELKKRISSMNEEYYSLKNWVEENNINLNTEENEQT